MKAGADAIELLIVWVMLVAVATALLPMFDAAARSLPLLSLLADTPIEHVLFQLALPTYLAAKC